MPKQAWAASSVIFVDCANNYEREEEYDESGDHVSVVNEIPTESENGMNDQNVDEHVSEQGETVNDQEPPNKKSKLEQLAAQLEQPEICGPKIEEHLVAIVNYVTRNEQARQEMFNKMDAIPRPVNCANLIETRVNKLIWDRITPATRDMDSGLQKIQRSVIKTLTTVSNVVTALTKMTIQIEECNEKDKCICTPIAAELDQMVDATTETVYLLGYANYEMNMKRRELLKPDLSYDYAQLCKPSNAPTDMLLGDDPESKIKTNTETNQQGSKVAKRRNGRDFAPRGRGSRGRGGFRGGRGRGFVQPDRHNFLGYGAQPQAQTWYNPAWYGRPSRAQGRPPKRRGGRRGAR